MRLLDSRERLEARQVWLELGLRETWHADLHLPSSCMDRPRYYILHHGQVREADFPAWAAWAYTHLADRLIRHTLVENVQVDTVFLAFNQGNIGDGPPILFETVVQGGPVDGTSARYTTLHDAIVGHETIVEGIKQGALANTSLTRANEIDPARH